MRARGDGGAGRVVRVAKWVVVSAVVVVVGGAAVPVAADPEEAAVATTEAATAVPDREAPFDLVDSHLEKVVADLAAGTSPPSDVVVRAGAVRVEIRHELSASAVTAAIEHAGGVVHRLTSTLAIASVPFDRLAALEAEDGIRYARLPLDLGRLPVMPAGPTESLTAPAAELLKTNVDAWHAAGYLGSVVKVGIIDVFGGGLIDAAQAAGELPPLSGEFCRRGGVDCSWASWTVDHGVAVAEIIHDMAPQASLYFVNVRDLGDYYDAIDYLAANGVDVISRSLSHDLDGPGDGTGDFNEAVDYAVSLGMIWLNAAGNRAGGDGHGGQYWRGTYVDDNGNGFIEFKPGDEGMTFQCVDSTHFLGIRWNDWGSPNPTDYNVAVKDQNGAVLATSQNDQTSGADPLENPFAYDCPNAGDINYLTIELVDPGDGAAGDIIEVMGYNTFVVDGNWQSPYSVSMPAADSANPGAMAVGAIDPPSGVDIAYYSSQGPTNDERIKPDLSAVAGITTFTTSSPFIGTSAATPVVAGAVALVIDAGLGSSPASVNAWLLTNAVSDRGAAGPDPVFGHGELILPTPPEPPPTLQITSPAAGAMVSGLVTITAAATGTVTAVEFAVDGSPIGIDVDGGDGWSMVWDSASVADGNHTLSVEAVNDSRATDSVEVISVNAPPSLTITQPPDGATVHDLTKIAASSTGDVTSVRFEIDGSLIGIDTTPGDGWQWFWATGNVADGPHSVTVRAGNNAAVSDTITVTVDNAAMLAITAPPSGATVSGTVAIQVASTGDIDGVRFEIDGGLVGIDTTAGDGWRFEWDTVGTLNGPHVITVRATNDATVSDSRGIIVNNPVMLCRGLVATIVGTAGDDFLTGTAGPDVIHGLGGDDSLSGLGGDDVICGGDGEDFLYGGPGDDTLAGQAHHDNLNGGDGDDILLGGGDDDYLSGGAGNDLLRGQLGDDWSWGEAGDDRIQDGPGNDGLDGGPGKDKLWGGMGADLLWGGEGRDQMHGGRDNDSLYGDADTDRMWGDSGDDHLSGGPGSDFLYGGIGADDLWGDDGNDRLFGWTGNDELWGGPGRDQLRGQDGNDMVNGGLHVDWCSVETVRLNCERML